MWERLFGVLFILLGVWQVYASKRYGHQVTKHGDTATSPFSLLALGNSFYLGVIFAGMGVALLLGAF